MKKQSENLNDDVTLRKKAEEQLKSRNSVSDSIKSFSEVEIQKLFHELEVYQIELEMQNEELLIAKNKAEQAEEKYIELYDFAPSGYLTLSKEGEISELNLAAAKILGMERSYLKNKRFVSLISANSTETFNIFFKKIFTQYEKQNCEIKIATKSNFSFAEQVLHTVLNIEGIMSPDGNFCLLNLNDITKHKLAEEALNVSNSFNNILIRLIPFGINIVDKEGNILFQNEIIKKNVVENNLNKKCWELYRDDKKQCSDCPLHFEIKEGETLIYEASGVMGGKVFEIYHTGINYLGKDALLEIFIDITERKAAEEAIQASQQINAGILDSIPVRVFWKDINLNYLGCNKIFAEDSGLGEPKNLIGKDDYQMSWRDQAELYRIDDRKVIESGISRINFEESQTTPEKNIITLLTSKIPLKDTKGNINGILGIYYDITKRKQEEKIKEIKLNIANSIVNSETVEDLLIIVRNELNQLFDTTNFFVALYNSEKNTLKRLHWVDEKDDIEEWDAGKTISGYVVKTAKTLLLKNHEIRKFKDKHNLSTLGTISECWLGVPLIIAKKAIGVMVIQSYTDPDAYDMSIAELFENIAKDLSVFIDKQKIFKELNIALKRAEESDNLKTAFLHNISHEIRTPFNGILGFLQLIQDAELSNSEKEEFFTIINKSSDRLMKTISDIVEISQIQSGDIKTKKTNFNINYFISETFNEFKIEAELKGLQFHISNNIPKSIENINTDNEKLITIISILLDNAIKFTKTGEIELGCLYSDQFIFYVKDTGIGISLEKHKIIFERFVQADSTNTREYEGSGLGLAIAYEYIKILGGNIWLESEIGRGTTFYISIPYIGKSESKVETLNITPINNENFLLKSLKILIVEDDETSIKLLQIHLKNYSREYLVVRNGIEAVDACRNHPDIDLVLMDINLPEMTGYKATQQIRKFNKDVIIIAQTAYSFSIDREKAIEAGCNDYIPKPINKDTLILLLEKYFKKKISNISLK